VTTERQALDRLLAAHPDWDLIRVSWMTPEDRMFVSPWLIVVLGQRSEDGSEAWAHHRYAIWKKTGAIHGIQDDNSVTDDPLPI